MKMENWEEEQIIISVKQFGCNDNIVCVYYKYFAGYFLQMVPDDVSLPWPSIKPRMGSNWFLTSLPSQMQNSLKKPESLLLTRFSEERV